jgi:hypothetical protein
MALICLGGISVRIRSSPAEIRTGYGPNISLNYCSYTKMVEKRGFRRKTFIIAVERRGINSRSVQRAYILKKHKSMQFSASELSLCQRCIHSFSGS